MKICIINSPYYGHIASMLLDGAVEELQKEAVAYEVFDVPGALEIPVLASMLLQNNRSFDGFIALGCVIRGETSHYDIVAEESAKWLLNLSIQYNMPITNGILTVENESQAIARADKLSKNKGGFAAKACIEMIKLKNKIIAS